MLTRSLLTLVGALSVASTALAADIVVPEDQPTLTAAAAVAQPGDRIVLARGAHVAEGELAISGVTIMGKRASIRGGLSITGDDVTLSRVRLEDGAVKIVGARATIDRCRLTAAPLLVEGDGATVQDSKVRSPGSVGVAIVGNDGLIAGVRASDLIGVSMLQVTGDDAVVEDCRISKVFRDLAIDQSNAPPFAGIRIVGDRAQVDANRVIRSAIAVWVEGGSFAIAKNKIALRRSPGQSKRSADTIGILASSPDESGSEGRSTISNNRVGVERGAGVNVYRGDGVDVVDNRIRVKTDPSYPFLVTGDDNLIQGNSGSGARGRTSTIILGDRNIIRDNKLANVSVDGVDNVVD